MACKGSALLLWLTAAVVWLGVAKGQTDPSLIFVSHNGTVTHRVHCTERLVCTGRGDNVFWTFLGFGAVPISNSTTRKQIITREVVNGMTQTTATLLFDPVIPRFPESYVCQIVGDNPIGVNVRVVINTDPADIVSRAEQSTFNISGHTVGDPFSFPCQVETCRDDYHVRFTMNSMVVHSVQPNTTSNTTFNYEFPVRDNSAGTYSCFVDLPSLMFMSARETLTLTGVPMQPPTSATTPTSSSSQPPGGTTPPMVTPTPTAGAKQPFSELAILLSLFLVTIIAVTL